MDYFKWFITKGFKKYLIPFLLGGFITWADIHEYDYLKDSPKIILYLMWFTLAAFNLGIVYHSYLTFKADK